MDSDWQIASEVSKVFRPDGAHVKPEKVLHFQRFVASAIISGLLAPPSKLPEISQSTSFHSYATAPGSACAANPDVEDYPAAAERRPMLCADALSMLTPARSSNTRHGTSGITDSSPVRGKTSDEMDLFSTYNSVARSDASTVRDRDHRGESSVLRSRGGPDLKSMSSPSVIARVFVPCLGWFCRHSLPDTLTSFSRCGGGRPPLCAPPRIGSKSTVNAVSFIPLPEVLSRYPSLRPGNRNTVSGVGLTTRQVSLSSCARRAHLPAAVVECATSLLRSCFDALVRVGQPQPQRSAVRWSLLGPISAQAKVQFSVGGSSQLAPAIRGSPSIQFECTLPCADFEVIAHQAVNQHLVPILPVMRQRSQEEGTHRSTPQRRSNSVARSRCATPYIRPASCGPSRRYHNMCDDKSSANDDASNESVVDECVFVKRSTTRKEGKEGNNNRRRNNKSEQEEVAAYNLRIDREKKRQAKRTLAIERQKERDDIAAQQHDMIATLSKQLETRQQQKRQFQEDLSHQVRLKQFSAAFGF